MSALPGPKRPYQDHLRYKHMVARLDKLPFYKLEAAVLAEIAKGRRWRIDAALEALAKNKDRFTYVNYIDIFAAAGCYGRLTAMHRLTAIYKSEKLDRSKDQHGACSHGILDAFAMATLHGHTRVADYLLQFGAAPDYLLRDSRPQRAMPVAIMQGDMKKIEYLLSRGAHASVHLHTAVAAGNHAIVERLLDAGADINIKSNGHWTPLHAAARRGDLAMVDMLVARGAAPDACASDMLYDITYRERLPVFDRLLELGFKPDRRDLENALSKGLPEFAARMIARGVMPTPEMLVHALGDSKESASCVRLCLDNGVDPAAALHWLQRNTDSYKYSPPGTREKMLATLESLSASAPAASKPPKFG